MNIHIKCPCVCVHVYQCATGNRAHKGHQIPRDGITGDCELPNLGLRTDLKC